MKYAAIGALFVPTMVLTMTGVAVVAPAGLASIFNPARTASPRRCTPTRRSRTTTAARSPATARRTSRRRSATVALYFGRFVPLLAGLALGGSLVKKRVAPVSAGTFRTDGATFGILLLGVIALTAGLMILPALTLGPIVEGLS